VVRRQEHAMTCWKKTVPSKSNCYKPVGSTNDLSVENAFEQVFKNKRLEKRNVPLFRPNIQFIDAFLRGKITESR